MSNVDPLPPSSSSPTRPATRRRTAGAAALFARAAALAGSIAAGASRATIRAALLAAAQRIVPGASLRLAGRHAHRQPGRALAFAPRGTDRAPVTLLVEPTAPPLRRRERAALGLVVDAAGAALVRRRDAWRIARLRAESERDFLTGMLTRRLALRLIAREQAKARRTRRPLALVMIDVDQFKAWNDRHGHLAGDDVLRRLARLLAATTRASDVVARFGGEEFLIALPETTVEEAVVLAERLRQAVAARGLGEAVRAADAPPTISIGIVAVAPDDTLESAIDRADRALYESKRRGRNCFSLGIPKGVVP